MDDSETREDSLGGSNNITSATHSSANVKSTHESKRDDSQQQRSPGNKTQESETDGTDSPAASKQSSLSDVEITRKNEHAGKYQTDHSITGAHESKPEEDGLLEHSGHIFPTLDTSRKSVNTQKCQSDHSSSPDTDTERTTYQTQINIEAENHQIGQFGDGCQNESSAHKMDDSETREDVGLEDSDHISSATQSSANVKSTHESTRDDSQQPSTPGTDSPAGTGDVEITRENEHAGECQTDHSMTGAHESKSEEDGLLGHPGHTFPTLDTSRKSVNTQKCQSDHSSSPDTDTERTTYQTQINIEAENHQIGQFGDGFQHESSAHKMDDSETREDMGLEDSDHISSATQSSANVKSTHESARDDSQQPSTPGNKTQESETDGTDSPAGSNQSSLSDVEITRENEHAGEYQTDHSITGAHESKSEEDDLLGHSGHTFATQDTSRKSVNTQKCQSDHSSSPDTDTERTTYQTQINIEAENHQIGQFGDGFQHESSAHKMDDSETREDMGLEDSDHISSATQSSANVKSTHESARDDSQQPSTPGNKTQESETDGTDSPAGSNQSSLSDAEITRENEHAGEYQTDHSMTGAHESKSEEDGLLGHPGHTFPTLDTSRKSVNTQKCQSDQSSSPDTDTERTTYQTQINIEAENHQIGQFGDGFQHESSAHKMDDSETREDMGLEDSDHISSATQSSANVKSTHESARDDSQQPSTPGNKTQESETDGTDSPAGSNQSSLSDVEITRENEHAREYQTDHSITGAHESKSEEDGLLGHPGHTFPTQDTSRKSVNTQKCQSDHSSSPDTDTERTTYQTQINIEAENHQIGQFGDGFQHESSAHKMDDSETREDMGLEDSDHISSATQSSANVKSTHESARDDSQQPSTPGNKTQESETDGTDSPAGSNQYLLSDVEITRKNEHAGEYQTDHSITGAHESKSEEDGLLGHSGHTFPTQDTSRKSVNTQKCQSDQSSSPDTDTERTTYQTQITIAAENHQIGQFGDGFQHESSAHKMDDSETREDMGLGDSDHISSATQSSANVKSTHESARDDSQQPSTPGNKTQESETDGTDSPAGSNQSSLSDVEITRENEQAGEYQTDHSITGAHESKSEEDGLLGHSGHTFPTLDTSRKSVNTQKCQSDQSSSPDTDTERTTYQTQITIAAENHQIGQFGDGFQHESSAHKMDDSETREDMGLGDSDHISSATQSSANAKSTHESTRDDSQKQSTPGNKTQESETDGTDTPAGSKQSSLSDVEITRENEQAGEYQTDHSMTGAHESKSEEDGLLGHPGHTFPTLDTSRKSVNTQKCQSDHSSSPDTDTERTTYQTQINIEAENHQIGQFGDGFQHESSAHKMDDSETREDMGLEDSDHISSATQSSANVKSTHESARDDSQQPSTPGNKTQESETDGTDSPAGSNQSSLSDVEITRENEHAGEYQTDHSITGAHESKSEEDGLLGHSGHTFPTLDTSRKSVNTQKCQSDHSSSPDTDTERTTYQTQITIAAENHQIGQFGDGFQHESSAHKMDDSETREDMGLGDSDHISSATQSSANAKSTHESTRDDSQKRSTPGNKTQESETDGTDTPAGSKQSSSSDVENVRENEHAEEFQTETDRVNSLGWHFKLSANTAQILWNDWKFWILIGMLFLMQLISGVYILIMKNSIVNLKCQASDSATNCTQTKADGLPLENATDNENKSNFEDLLNTFWEKRERLLKNHFDEKERNFKSTVTKNHENFQKLKNKIDEWKDSIAEFQTKLQNKFAKMEEQMKTLKHDLDDAKSKLNGLVGQQNELSKELNDTNVYIVGFLLATVIGILFGAYKFLIEGPNLDGIKAIGPIHRAIVRRSSPDAIIEKMKRKRVRKGILVISFCPSTQEFHRDVFNAVSESSSLEYIVIQRSSELINIDPRKLVIVFVDFNNRNIVLENTEDEAGYIRKQTTETFLNLGCDVFVVYCKDTGSSNLPPNKLYNTRLYSIERHPVLSELKKKDRVLSIYNCFHPHQVEHLNKYCQNF